MGQISVTPEELKQQAQVYIRSKDKLNKQSNKSTK